MHYTFDAIGDVDLDGDLGVLISVDAGNNLDVLVGVDAYLLIHLI